MEKRIKRRIGALVVVGMFVAMLYLPGVIAPDGETVLQVDGSYRINIDNNGDEDDRIFSVSHDDNDAELFRIQENGNVGVGTTSPTAKLDVAGDAKISDSLNVDSGTLYVDNVNDRVGIGWDSPAAKLVIVEPHAVFVFNGSESTSGYITNFTMDDEGLKIGHTSTIRDIQFQTASTTRVRITGDGKVGIGTMDPRYILDVKARSEVGEAIFTGEGLNDMTSGGTFIGSTPLAYRVQIDGEGIPDTFKWSDDGGSTWDETGVAITGSAQPLSYGVTVTFGATTGHTLGDYWRFYTSVTNPFSVQNAAGTRSVYVGNDGLVGIGTTSPDEELHVVGNIKMVDGNQGAGKVLTSDANGVGTWQEPQIGIGGSGTTNYIPKFTDSTTLGNSIIYENNGQIGIGTTAPVTTLDVNGGLATNTVYVNAILFPGGYIAGPTDFLILVDTTAGPVTVFLPPVIGVDGQILVIKKIDAIGGLPGTVTITPLGGEPIDGWPTPLTFNTQWTTFTIQASGPNPLTPTGQWYTI